MTETRETITLTMPADDAEHMVTVLTKLETASTMRHVNVQLVTDNTGAVTLCATAYATAHGFGITQLTQHYPNSTGDMADIVTFVLAASDLKKRLRERTQTAGKAESISITLEVAPNTTVNSVCESPVKPPVQYENTFTIGQKELNTLQVRHTYTRFKDTGFEMMNIVYTPGNTMGHVYSTNRYVITCQVTRFTESSVIADGESVAGEDDGRSRANQPGTGDVSLELTYGTLAVYNTAAAGGVSVVKHDTAGNFTITDGGTTTLVQTVMGDSSKALAVQKYSLDLHSDSMAGAVRGEDNLVPMARFKYKTLVTALKGMFEATGGGNNSYNAKSTVLIRNTDEGVEFLVRNWGNDQTAARTIPAAQDEGTVRWEPTARYVAGKDGGEEQMECERRLVTYNTLSMLNGLATCQGKWVSVMPPKYFTDDLIVYVHDDPDTAGDKGSWFMLPLSKTEMYLHQRDKE